MPSYPVEQYLAQSWPPAQWQGQSVVLAVSGGTDSIAMLRAMHRLRGKSDTRLIVGHVHHGLRGAAADVDANFVRELCEQLGVACHVGRVDGSTRGDGVEAAARDARYNWLVELAQSEQATAIATAHTADDQAETIIHRIVRGTGIGGLAGIPTTREIAPGITLVRPLLDCTRGEIESYLDEFGQSSCEDETNRSADFTRNRIRHNLLPLLEEQYNPQVREALLKLGRVAGEVQSFIDKQVAELFDASCIVSNDTRAILKPMALADIEPYLIRELLIHLWKLQSWPLQSMGYDQWQRLVDMIRDPAASAQTFPGPIRAEKQGEQLVLTRPVDD